MEYTLKWGGIHKGKTVTEIEFKIPDSSLALLKDQFRGSPTGFIHQVLAVSTVAIGGDAVGNPQAVSFWDTVKMRDAEVALIELVKMVWPGKCTGAEQIIRCNREHETDVVIDLTNFEQLEVDEKSIMVDLDSPIEIKGQKVTSIIGEIPDIGQIRRVEKLLDEKPTEGGMKIISMCCQAQNEPGKPIAMAYVQKMLPPDRKKVEAALRDTGKMIDLTIKGTCGSCGRPAEGPLDIAVFF